MRVEDLTGKDRSDILNIHSALRSFMRTYVNERGELNRDIAKAADSLDQIKAMLADHSKMHEQLEDRLLELETRPTPAPARAQKTPKPKPLAQWQRDLEKHRPNFTEFGNYIWDICTKELRMRQPAQLSKALGYRHSTIYRKLTGVEIFTYVYFDHLWELIREYSPLSKTDVFDLMNKSIHNAAERKRKVSL